MDQNTGLGGIDSQFNLYVHTPTGQRECELFITIVSMASNNLGSYVSLIKLLKSTTPTGNNRNIKIMQLEMFGNKQRGVFENSIKPPLFDHKSTFFGNPNISRIPV